MSILSVFHVASPGLAHKVLTHHEDIVATLAEAGVRFARWQSAVRLRPGCAADEVLDAFRAPLDQLMTEYASATAQVLSCDGATAAAAALREEHVHKGAEVFAVLSGRGQWNLRLGEHVYAVLCEKDDVLVLPAETRRWLDLGEQPFCLAVRLFAGEQQGEPHFTGDASAQVFAGMDEL